MKPYMIQTEEEPVWTGRRVYRHRGLQFVDYYIAGYVSHLGDCDHKAYPKFNDDGVQVSGATCPTTEDLVAWFRRDWILVKFERMVWY